MLSARNFKYVRLRADLHDRESIRETITTQSNWSEATKETMVYAYDLFVKWMRIRWERPIYKA